MKKIFGFLVLFYLLIPLFAQEYRDSKVTYVNPKPGITFPPFRKISITRPTPILPSAKSDVYDIVYSIYDETGTLVYKKSITNRFENALELFFTEDSMFGMRVPEFSWNGSDYDDDYERLYREKIVTETVDGREYKYVKDGKYKIVIAMKTGTDRTEKLETLQEFAVVVDTTPLDFTLRTIVSREDSLDQSSFSLYANEFAKEWVVMVDNITIKTITPQSEEMLTLSLPVQTFSGEEFAGEHMIRVKATDLANNVSFQECQLVISPHSVADGNGDPYQGPFEVDSSTPDQETPVAPLSIKREGRYPYLDVPDIVFLPFKSNCLGPGSSSKNVEYLTKLADLVKPHLDEIRYIHINGFAYPTKLNSSRRALQTEHDRELVPLSLARAENIKEMLILLGIPSGKIKTHGLGASEVIANPKNGSWKNSNSRRVRLWIEK
ncbi:hypothetical protein AGMMS50268_05540 [Spirochaetia bacterium]|nr:hypothetical protein AGMMS50268_05540 [Spirochaetia bacterium]